MEIVTTFLQNAALGLALFGILVFSSLIVTSLVGAIRSERRFRTKMAALYARALQSEETSR